MEPINPISSQSVLLTPVGGSVGASSGTTISSTQGIRNIVPIQLLGFIPLVSCTLEECRQFNGKCYFNPVFGSLNVNGTTYENDLSTFFLDDTLRRVTIFTLQKVNSFKVWEDVAVIGSTFPALFPYVTTYGTFYNYGTFATHPKYLGIQINWGYVLTNNGSGKYRLKVTSPAVVDTKPKPYPYCLVSEPFELFPWNCDRAHGTAKFEANQSGKIGSIDTDGVVFDICNIRLYDSIRQKGFFGYEKTGYDETMLEYQNGLMDRVRDEAIQRFDWVSEPMPKYIHDRFKSYGMMPDSLWVSDYNKNNADYNIKRKAIVKSAGYEPEYPKGSRLSWVKTEFKEGIQGVIKSSACEKTTR